VPRQPRDDSGAHPRRLPAGAGTAAANRRYRSQLDHGWSMSTAAGLC